jgi:hypothetical protein
MYGLSVARCGRFPAFVVVGPAAPPVRKWGARTAPRRLAAAQHHMVLFWSGFTEAVGEIANGQQGGTAECQIPRRHESAG